VEHPLQARKNARPRSRAFPHTRLLKIHLPGAAPAGVEVPAPIVLESVDWGGMTRRITVSPGAGTTTVPAGAGATTVPAGDAGTTVVVVVRGMVVTVPVFGIADGASVPLLFIPAPPRPVPTSLRVEPSPIPAPVLRATPLVVAPSAVVGLKSVAGVTVTVPGFTTLVSAVPVNAADEVVSTLGVLVDFPSEDARWLFSLSSSAADAPSEMATSARAPPMETNRFIYLEIGGVLISAAPGAPVSRIRGVFSDVEIFRTDGSPLPA
jgi:hypothetical protein